MGIARTFSGRIWNGRLFEDGHLTVEDGILRELEFGERLKGADFEGCILPGITDSHTHVADAGLKLDRKYGLEELVAPPDGLKHRYLSGTDEAVIRSEMGSYVGRLKDSGVSRFMDFREGGIAGARMLRDVSDRAVILGRPVSKEYDPNEIDGILEIADGIGIPSITDMDHGYIDSIADHVHRKNKMLALHVSERIREDIDYVLSLDPDFIVHMVQAADPDFRKCADSGIPISVCPSSNLYFGMIPPIKRMLDAGVDISLGTDNGMLFPSADIFDELRVMSQLTGTQIGDAESAFRTLYACGNKVLYEETLTQNKTGKKADLVAFPCTEKELLAGKVSGRIRYGP